MVKRVRERNHRTEEEDDPAPAGAMEFKTSTHFQRPCRGGHGERLIPVVLARGLASPPACVLLAVLKQERPN